MFNYLLPMKKFQGWRFIVNYGTLWEREYKIYNSKDSYYAVLTNSGKLVGIASNLVNAQYLAISYRSV